MSFSREVKEEICNTYFNNVRDVINGFLYVCGKNYIYRTDSETSADFLSNNTGICSVNFEKRFVITIKNTRDVDADSYIKNARKVFDTDTYSDDTENVSDSRLRMFISGVFLACGTVTNPESEYYLDLNLNGEDKCSVLHDTLNTIGIKFRRIPQKRRLYIKDGETIADFLTYIGASNCAMQIINTRIYKEVINNVNRAVNCETANIEKTVRAASKLQNDIEFIFSRKGEKFLEQDLLDAALIRRENTDLSLREIGEILKISKSGVNHRFEKIMKIADELRKLMHDESRR